MSQFYGYTVDVVLKDPQGKTIRGIIDRIGDKEIVLKNPVNVLNDGSCDKADAKELNLNTSNISDLNVVELVKNNSKYIKKQMKILKEQEQDQDQDQQDSLEVDLESDRDVKKKETGKINKLAKISNKGSNNKTNASSFENDSVNSSKKDLAVKYVDVYNEKPSSKPKKINQLEEFDFASNLQKFDKASVFEDISKNDKIDQSSRLVSFNKVNTNNRDQDKYGIDEMVLKKKHSTGWDDNNIYDYSNIMNPISKSNNTTVESNISDASENLLAALQSRQTSFDRKYSLSSTSAQFFSSFYGDTPIPTCSTLQLSEIFNICITKFDLTEQILNENSARSISELIINNVIGNFRIGFKNHNEPPLILLLVGNNKTGSTTLASGRHLFNRGLKTIAYLLYDKEHSEDELLVTVDEELKRYSNVGGRIVNSLSQLETILKNTEGSPLEFILDGLQGFDTDLNDLVAEELSQATKLMDWCNLTKLPIMSLDIPTGLNPSSGTTENDTASIINSKYVVSVGLPLSSALNIYKFGYFDKGKVSHYLVDSGIPRRVFTTKSNLRKFDRRWFSDSSNIDLKVV
jgi:enhancer of mRNA-decapping protein 3